jgi:hypothetical protein
MNAIVKAQPSAIATVHQVDQVADFHVIKHVFTDYVDRRTQKPFIIMMVAFVLQQL